MLNSEMPLTEEAHERLARHVVGLRARVGRRHGGRGRDGRRVLLEQERDRGQRGDQDDRHGQQPALHEGAPDQVEGLHRVAPAVAVVVGTDGPPAGVAAGVVAAGPAGVAPAVRPCACGTRYVPFAYCKVGIVGHRQARYHRGGACPVCGQTFRRE